MRSIRIVCSKLLRATAARALQALRLGLVVFVICVSAFSQGNQGRITGTIFLETWRN